MHRFVTGRSLLLAVAAAACALVTAASATALPAPGSSRQALAPGSLPAPGSVPALRAACAAARPGHVRCFALFRPQTAVNRAIAAGITGPAAQPQGWAAKAIEAAYRLPVSRASHQTVAVSIAFDTPKLATYLAVYRKQFGLPPCTVTSGCFRKVNQMGKLSPLPVSGVHTGWDLEAALDVSMISVACPHCKILVVEANDNGFANLALSEDTAVRLGASVVSNSYGGDENGFTTTFARDYDHPHHTIVVSSGDSGFGQAQAPADFATVTAVGGTEFHRAHNRRGWAERAWNQPSAPAAGGSGCSAYVAKPGWQHDAHCPGRTVADVAALATNVPVFNADYGGWITVAGTSVSAPLVAGVYGLAGNATGITPAFAYRHRRGLFDITAGDNVMSGTPRGICGGDYLCMAKQGYDAPTGLGTPDGTGAF